MGYCMSRFDDVRLDGDDGGLETRRESFFLRWESIIVYGLADGSLTTTLEIAYADVPRLRELLDVAMAKGAGEGPLQPPTSQQKKAWAQGAADASLLDATGHLTDADLKRALELRQDVRR